MPTLLINGHKTTLDQQEFAHFHGTSVFTTLRSKRQEALLFERHWTRLKLHAAYFGFPMPMKELVGNLLKEELKTKICDQKIRIIIAGERWALSLEDAEIINANIYDGVDICISKYQTHPQFANLKTSNSLPYILASQEAKNQGVFEALLLNNQGYICDGSRTSIMLYDGTDLCSLQGGLDGCMREEALAYARSIGINTKTCFKKPDQINGQTLLANSILGVVPVGEIKYNFVREIIDFFRMDKTCISNNKPLFVA